MNDKKNIEKLKRQHDKIFKILDNKYDFYKNLHFN